MKDSNSIAVTTMGNLEEGDVFAYEFLGGVISGVVWHVVFYSNELTELDREYMRANALTIPEGRWVPINGATGCLVLGDFVDSNVKILGTGPHAAHMYVDTHTPVVVFPNAKLSNDREKKRLETLAREERETEESFATERG